MAKKRLDGLAYVQSTWGEEAREVAECAIDRAASWSLAVKQSQKTMDGKMLVSLVSSPFLALQVQTSYAIEMGTYVAHHLLPASVSVLFTATSMPGGDQKINAPSFPELHGQIMDLTPMALMVFLAELSYRKRMTNKALGYLEQERIHEQRVN